MSQKPSMPGTLPGQSQVLTRRSFKNPSSTTPSTPKPSGLRASGLGQEMGSAQIGSNSYNANLIRSGTGTHGSDLFLNGEGSFTGSAFSNTPHTPQEVQIGIFPPIEHKKVKDVVGTKTSTQFYCDTEEIWQLEKFTEKQKKQESVEKTQWKMKIQQDLPELRMVREIVYPLHRASALVNKFNPGKQKVKEKIGKKEVVELILQHLHVKGYNKTREVLENESKIKTPKHKLNQSVLLHSLYNSINNSENVYDIAVGQRNITVDNANATFKEYQMNTLIKTSDDSKKMYEDEEVKKLEGTTFQDVSLNDNSDKNMNVNTIVFRLTACGSTVGDFDKAIYMFLTTITTPEKFFLKLMERLDIPQDWKPENNTPVDRYKMNVTTKIANCIKTWVDTCAVNYDIPTKKGLIKIMEDYSKSVEGAALHIIKTRITALKTSIENDIKNKATNSLIKRNLLIEPLKEDNGVTQTQDMTKSVVENKNKQQPQQSQQDIDFAFFRQLVPKIKFIDIDEDTICYQFTYMQASIFYQLQPSEFFGQAWAKAKLRHKAPNIIASTQLFNFISSFFVNLILDTPDLDERVKLVKKIIKIGIKAHSINNYDLLYSIAGAVGDAAIFRMKQTWNQVNQDPEKAQFDQLSQLFQKNYAGYRKEIETKSQIACIPFIGTSLTDITFLDDGNSDMVGDKINVEKKMRLYQCIQGVIKFKDIKYDIAPIHQIICFIKNYYFEKGLLTDEKAKYEKSLKTEARVRN